MGVGEKGSKQSIGGVEGGLSTSGRQLRRGCALQTRVKSRPSFPPRAEPSPGGAGGLGQAESFPSAHTEPLPQHALGPGDTGSPAYSPRDPYNR